MKLEKTIYETMSQDLNNEKKLLIEAKGGSIEAFEKILFFYEKPIYNYIYRLVKQKQDAEDLTQATFIKLYKSLKSINLDKNFKSWLYKIATNTTYDWFRKKKREAEMLVTEPDEYFETLEPDEAYYSTEDIQALDNALDKLKPIHKSVLLLFYKESLQYQEIAEALNLPINTVKTHIYRAKESLRHNLKI